MILDALGLSADVDVEALHSRADAFACVHTGMSDLRVETLLDVIAGDPALVPPRTGHLGNWDDIADGRAGPMDFNQTICVSGFGYPLIYCFTQTEADSGAGDWVYLPGSLVRDGVRHPLPLLTWDGRSFTRRDRARPLFCPFVLTELDGERVPLTEVQWRRMRGLARLRFQLEPAVLAEHEDRVRAILTLLVEEAGARENPRRAFRDLFGHAVSPDGVVAAAEIARDGHGYRLNGVRFRDAAALVDAALGPFAAISDPRGFFARIGDLPPVSPVVSNLLAGILSAVFATDYPGAAPPAQRSIDTHLHWGARAMAGFPPRRRGYFVERSSMRSMRAICDALVRHFPEISPLCFVLLPASIFMLCPNSGHPRDAALMDELLEEVAAGDTDQARVDDLTRSWLQRRGAELSEYLLGRFVPGRGVLGAGERPASAEPVLTDRFRALSLRRACMAVGALTAAVPAGGS